MHLKDDEEIYQRLLATGINEIHGQGKCTWRHKQLSLCQPGDVKTFFTVRSRRSVVYLVLFFLYKNSFRPYPPTTFYHFLHIFFSRECGLSTRYSLRSQIRISLEQKSIWIEHNRLRNLTKACFFRRTNCVYIEQWNYEVKEYFRD